MGHDCHSVLYDLVLDHIRLGAACLSGGGKMKISYREFYTQLIGARLCDEHQWTSLKQEDCLWSMFEFDDHGATYRSPRYRHNEPDWGDVTKVPGYYEPEAWVIQ